MHNYKTKSTNVTFSMPDGWHEVPFIQGLAISANNYNNLELMSLLSGKTQDEIRDITDLETVTYFINSFEFLKHWPVGKVPEFPSSIRRRIGDEKSIELEWVDYYDTFDLGGCTVGQVEDMKHVIQQANPVNDIETIEIYSKICAIYLQPIVKFEDYDFNKAIKFEEEVERMDFKTITNMGGFFLLKLHGLTSGQTSVWKRAHSPVRKLKLALKSLALRLGFMRR